MFAIAYLQNVVCESFIPVRWSAFIIIAMVLVAELDLVGIGVRAEVDFIIGQEMFYSLTQAEVLEMGRLSLPHCA